MAINNNNEINMKTLTIHKEAKPLITKLESLEINSKTLATISELYSQAKSLYKQTYDARKLATNPLEQQIKEIEINYTPTEKALKAIIDKVKEGLSDYSTEQNRLLKLKQDKIASKIEDGKISLETAITKMSKLTLPEKKVGNVTFVSKQQLLITHPIAIPREYLIPDEKKIFEDLKEGKIIYGCEIEVVQIPRNG